MEGSGSVALKQHLVQGRVVGNHLDAGGVENGSWDRKEIPTVDGNFIHTVWPENQ